MMKVLKQAFFGALLLCNFSLSADDPEPYVSIHNLSYVPYYVENGYLLMDRINTHSASIVIDVDSENGGGARLVGQNTPDSVQIYSVSMWTSSEHAFQRFLSNVKQENTAS